MSNAGVIRSTQTYTFFVELILKGACSVMMSTLVQLQSDHHFRLEREPLRYNCIGMKSAAIEEA